MNRRCYILLLAVVGSSHMILSQSTLTGVVKDESNELLTGATVVLLDPIDSVMLSFSISDDEGRFRLDQIGHGEQLLQISFVGYATLLEPITTLSDIEGQELGIYTMSPIEEILQEITVKAEHIPIGLIGDTISYNTAAFKTKPGASVEDLLKNLPGVEVARDGSIKAMGEDVKNVLVDGKEFFGNDPTIATRNLEAEAVNKVQVFDKKSEIAQFTGIDDGHEEKTINLKLKEDYKHGGFGNINVNVGPKGKYSGKLNYNRFTPTVQAAAIIAANNINRQAFSFNEYIQFMGGLSNAFSGDHGMLSLGDHVNAQAPKGISDNMSGGLNFNMDFSNRFKLTSHYFYLSDDKDVSEQTDAQQFVDEKAFSSMGHMDRRTSDQNHRLSTKLVYKPNPLNQWIIKNKINVILNELLSTEHTSLANSIEMNTRTEANQQESSQQLGYEGSLQYRKRSKKEGRNWISTATVQIGNYDQDAMINNLIHTQSIDQSIEQLQNYAYQYRRSDLQSAYTEPLGKRSYLSLVYHLDLERETPKKDFYDITQGVENFNSALSGAFVKKTLQNKVGLRLVKNSSHAQISLGLYGQWSNIDGLPDDTSMIINSCAYNWLPSLSIDAALNGSKSIDFGYHTYVSLPTLGQLAPLPDNSNPNLLILGNPTLTPEYHHSVSLDYSHIDRFNFKNFFANLKLSIIQNKIVNDLTIDNNLLKISKPINTDLSTSMSGYISYSVPIRSLKLKFRSSLNSIFASYTSFLNGLESGTQESNTSISFTLGNRNKKSLDIDAGIRLNYNTRAYEVFEDFNQGFFNYSLFWDGSISLPNGWQVTSSFDFINYSDEFFAEALDYKLWNLSVNKGLDQNKWVIIISAYDLLGQNRGVNRTGGINSLYNTRYNILTRYVMVGLRYKLGRNKQKKSIEFG